MCDSKASLIKYLMQHHQNVPPIKKITDKESIKILRIDYECPLKKDYWRLTTYDNFAYHMGNVYEAWMDQIEHSYDHTYQFSNNFPTYPTISRVEYLFKSKFLKMIFKSAKVRRLFFRYKKMQKNMLRKN